MIPDGRRPGKPRPEEYPLSFRHCGGNVEKLAADFARLDALERDRQLSYRVDGATAGRRSPRRRRYRDRPRPGSSRPPSAEEQVLSLLDTLATRPDLAAAIRAALFPKGGRR